MIQFRKAALIFGVQMLFLAATGHLKAGNEYSFSGPRAFACGQASGLFRDVWSVQNNPGALGFTENHAAAVSFERRFSSFSLLAFSSAFRTEKYGCFGLAASRFGPDFFNQSRAGISWGKAFGIASLGLQGQWYQVSTSELGVRHYFLLNFGGISRLGEKLLFSGTISNITQTKSSDYTGRRLPTVLKAGMAFQANPAFLLIAELQKNLDEKAGVNAGIEYQFTQAASVRTGFSTASGTATLGFGLGWREFRMDAGSSWHTQLGFSHCIGIQYQPAFSATGKRSGQK